jgi:hypothetical protein
MIELKFLSDGVASVGLLWLRLFARVIPFVNAVKNASLRKFITLYHYIKAAVFTILATLLRSVKSAIMKLQRVLFRK